MAKRPINIANLAIADVRSELVHQQTPGRELLACGSDQRIIHGLVQATQYRQRLRRLSREYTTCISIDPLTNITFISVPSYLVTRS